jgi:putative tricarboxylic transport membrane protein
MTTPEAAPVPRRPPDRAARVIAAGEVVHAAGIWGDPSRLGGIVTYARIGPQTIPYAIALCLAGLGLWTIFEAVRGDFPEREPQEIRPVLWIVGGLLLQLLFIRSVGFTLATGAMFAAVAFGFGERRVWLSLPAGIILSAAVWLLFARGLALSLPQGPLEAALADGLAALLSGGARP